MSRRHLDPALRRALLAARDKREERGATGDGTVITPALEPDEALALDGLLSRRKPVLPGRPLRIALSRFEAALREYGIEPRVAYETVGDGPLRDRPAERAAARETRTGFRSWLAAHPVTREHPPIAAWLDEAERQGRVRADSMPLVDRALLIVGALPTPAPVQRTVLAAAMLDGDPHGLDPETPLHRLTVSLLGAAAGVHAGASPREVWAAWNVLVDPISSSVAALNLPPGADDRLARLLRLMHGSHVVLTQGQLAEADLRWPRGLDCFTCENPSVLIAAEHALGRRCPTLICTGGRPSDAVRLLLGSLRAGGARLRHHGDFDLAGVQILRDLEARYDAAPWRFDVASLSCALDRVGRRLPAPSTATLEEAVSAAQSGVAEELLIDDLLGDLRMPPGRARSRRLTPRAAPPRPPRPAATGAAPPPALRAASAMMGAVATPVITLTERFDEAVRLARDLHARQGRKGTPTPYIAHLLGVASLVLEDGGDEDEAIAALLHDAVEDQGGQATLERIREQFGERVAEIVWGCTDADEQPKPPWRARKDAYLAHLPTASRGALRVSLADKLHNARAILFDLRAVGPAVWDRFKTGRDGALWYYGALADTFVALEAGPMAHELRRTVDAIAEAASA